MYHQLETTTSCDDMANTINSITTTTVITAPASTVFKAAVACTSSPESLHSLISCTAPVAVLNSILGLYPTATGTISCDSTTIPGADLLTDTALTAAIREFRGLAGQRSSAVSELPSSTPPTARARRRR